ncbi:MAG TPA: hypothetical protein VHF92_09555 [Geodermatophilus sp.]|nr:hypothetical protein [Geodermatophilus sp.]
MTAPGRDPWADPATPTEPGPPYAGPPPSVPPYAVATYPPYGWPVYGTSYGPGPWGGWGPPPRQGPRRPGQLIAAAVLAFVQAAAVALASAYVFLLASLAAFAVAGEVGAAEAEALATEGTVLGTLQLGSVIALVVGGIMVLNRRSAGSWRTLALALGAQLALALYWVVRLSVLVGDLAGPDPLGVLIFGVLCFAAAPAVGLGLLLSRPARAWCGVGGTAGS